MRRQLWQQWPRQALAVGGLIALVLARPSSAEPQATTNLRSAKDTFVSSARPTEAFGANARMIVGWREPFQATRSLVSFPVHELARNQAVTDARLRLFVREAGPLGEPSRDIVVRRVSGDWSEGGATWSSFPGFDDKIWASRGLGTTGGWVDWSGLRDVVRRWRLPSWQRDALRNEGLYVQGYEAAGSYRAFDTREGPNAPELRLEHVTDTRPPVSVLEPLPPYVNAQTAELLQPGVARIRLRWTGSDPDPWTGIDHFRVYAQRNNGDWSLAADRVHGFSRDTAARDGGLYLFNVYAMDQAGNLEPAKPPEAQTFVDLTPPVAAVRPLPAYVKAPFSLFWEGADGPTGDDMRASGLASYDVFYRVAYGDWQPLAVGTSETGLVFHGPLVEGAVHEFMAGAADRAGNVYLPEAAQAGTLFDSLAPVVVFDPVPGITGTSFTVRWRGEDFGGSGAVAYDIQYRVNRGPWMDWVRDSADTARLFQGAYSNTYVFRGRARDAASNQGDYQAHGHLVVGVIDPTIFVTRLSFPWMGKGP